MTSDILWFRIAVLVTTVMKSASVAGQNSPFVWNCKNDYCERDIGEVQYDPAIMLQTDSYASLEVCRLFCGHFGAIWPAPTGTVSLSPTITKIHPNKILMRKGKFEDPADFLAKNFDIFIEDIKKECQDSCVDEDEAVALTIIFEISDTNMELNWATDETYTLRVSSDSNLVEISANSIFGARHGLETVKQLVAGFPSQYGVGSILVMNSDVYIIDSPVYPHRGLLLDTARNFLSIDAIKRQVDGLAASKMNVFHWHISDSQSFPFESLRVPKLTEYGAYSQQEVYRVDQIKELMEYARLRGVRVIFEIDAPAHAGNGWQFGPEEGLGNLSLCLNQQPWRQYCIQPPCGQLNPINENLYPILGELFNDIIDLVPSGEVFHMGGDEVFMNCWNTSQEIIDYLELSGADRTEATFVDLWGYFQNESLKQYDSKNLGNKVAPIVLWSSHLTQPKVIEKYLDKERYVIQTWVPASDTLPKDLAELGYKLVVSTKDRWYLDHGFWGGTTYHKWQDAYNNLLLDHPNVLGGEVCSWGEYIDDSGIDARVWPRAAAAAERLWTNPTTGSTDAQSRLARHRTRLVQRGIEAQAIIPEWCYYTEGQCP